MSQFATDFGAGGFDQLAEIFGETVTFTPRGGDARSITVIAHRRQRAQGASYGGNIVDVWAKIDAAEGISEAEMTLGGAKIAIAPSIGDTAKSYVLRNLIEQDHGMWHLEIDVNG